MSSTMNSLRPMAEPIEGHPDGAMRLNATMVLELLRQYAPDTPAAQRFLDIYHAAEADIAAAHPYWSEGKIRDAAFLETKRRTDIDSGEGVA